MKRYLLTFLILIGVGSLLAQTPTVSSLSATGTNVKWYNAATGGTAYTGSETLVNGQHYYASQIINGVESTSRLDVIATVTTTPTAPVTATHTASQTQIVWNWNASSAATGYKWNTTNNYGSAINLNNVLTVTQTGLSSNTTHTIYVWAYNGSCVSSVTMLTQTTLSQPATPLTFTNANATGNNGPTQTQVSSAYSGTSLAGNVIITTQGIQEWTVPETRSYQIEARGASGGGSLPGLGARMIGSFNLTAGDKLKIIVGQQGVAETYIRTYYAGGGGGGSFVYNFTSTTLLIVAGGGGGSGSDSGGYGGVIATADSNTGSAGLGGASDEGNSGAGYSGDGAIGTHGGTIAYSFTNGAVGGIGGEGGGIGYGGFGGGGGEGYADGGGGGGYSGGNVVVGDGKGGFGGGSYNSGFSQSNTAGYNTGQGSVIITPL